MKSYKIKIFDKFFFQTILLIILLESASLITFYYPNLQKILFLIITIILSYFIIKKIKYGIYILLTELIIGGQGYLFFYEIGNFKLSIRLTIFLIIFFVWFIKTLKQRNFNFIKNKFFYLVLSLFIIIAIAIIQAILKNRDLLSIFLDSNGYLYFGLIGIFLTTKINSLKNLNKNKIIQIFLAATSWISIKTILILMLFSYGLAKVGDNLFYKWIRDTRVGEITQMTYPIYRIFFQSHFYNLLALVLILSLLFLYTKKELHKNFALWLLLFLNLSTIIISQSRSFFVSGLLTLAVLFFSLIFIFKINWKKIIFFVVIIPILFYSNIIFVNIILNTQVNILATRLSDQTNNSSSISSRSAQIKPLLTEIKKSPFFGHGFAKKITYKNSDPRIKTTNNPTGSYTTYSFELGYLDIILKTGILGFLLYMFLIFYLSFKLFLLSKKQRWLFGIILGIFSLVITNFFTPYFNHPLGIGFILLSILIYNNTNKKEAVYTSFSK
ncbi:MAG: O-antigen ligase family protein [Candidatus Magasanikbacteria bacterium]